MLQRGNKGENEEGKDGGRANWSRESLFVLCDLCLEHVDVSKGKSGSKTCQRISWKILEAAFRTKTNLPYDKVQLKHKYDWMKTRWSLWKQLKGKDTGLGWDHGKKTVGASKEWWDKKIKENSNFRTFKDEGIEPELEDKMDQLFGASVATGGRKYTPVMDPPSPSENVQHEEDIYYPSPPYSGNVAHNLSFASCDYMDESGGSNTGSQNGIWQQLWGEHSPSSSPCPTPSATQNEGNTRNKGKGKRVPDSDILQTSKSAKTDSTTTRKGGVALLTEKIDAVLQTIADRNTARMTYMSLDTPTFSVGDGLAMLMKISDLAVGSPEFCFACTMIEDVAKRTILFGLPDDKARIEYIKFQFKERKHS